MKLLLTSEGISNQSIAKAFFDLAGKPFETCSVTYIPTAGNLETGDKSWITMDMDTIRRFKPRSFDIVDISVAPKNVWQESFRKADILALGGGSVSYLLEWLEKSGVKKALPELLRTRVYLGLSAGSMVTAKTISLSKVSLQYYEKTGKLENVKGLGFVDFEIRPHLNSSNFPKVRLNNLEKIARESSTTFYAIDDTSAVRVDGNTVSVVSEGKWKKFH